MGNRGEREVEASTLWAFAQGLWYERPLRQALWRFQQEFQQPACLLLALAWLAATHKAPAATLIAALRTEAEQWERERMAALRQLVRATAGDAEQASWHQALLRAQLEGEKLLLARLQALIEAQPLPYKPVALDTLVLQALPEIGFCEGQSQLLAELVAEWQRVSEAGQ